jgi:adhesin transport system outer membrane protein
MVGRRLDVSITQLLYDFGATGAAARSAELNRDAASDNLEATKQQLLLRAITAYLNVSRSGRVLQFARESVVNIRRQAELEDALVKRGAGLSTDVLQAKTQLAGAQARRVQAEGALNVNRNIYRTVFGSDPGSLNSMVKPKLPVDALPQTANQAVTTAMRENPQLTAAESSALVTRESIKTAESLFLPRFDAVAQSTYKEDSGGTVGHQQEALGKVQLSFPFNLGFTAVNTLNAAERDNSSADQRLIEARRIIEEQVRNSWQNMLTARENSTLLRNQANIAAEFLELARKER